MTSSFHDIADAAWGESTPEPLSWQYGPWRLDVRGDELADIRFDGTLVLRSVRAVVRDRDWGTVPTRGIDLSASENRLRVTLRQHGLGAQFSGLLELDADGDTLTVGYTATAQAPFERNRIGLVVLHPPTVAGSPLVVTATDGSTSNPGFPLAISPHQPALDIARLDWTDGGVSSTIDFTGETFEMEDQRNWTDASFKTYSTPLALPFPVGVAAGEQVRQSISLHCARVGTEVAAGAAASVLLVPTGHRMPSIVVGAATAPVAAPDAPAPAASALLVELDTTTVTWRDALDRAIGEAGGLPLDVRIVTDAAGSVAPVLDALAGIDVVRLGVYSATTHVSEPHLWAALEREADRRGTSAELVGGARAHFTELNREHYRLPDAIPALTFSVTPQMHAREREQLVESIAMQRAVAENAVRIAAGRAVHVGPVTLRPRFNAVATSGGGPDERPLARVGYGAALEPGATDARQSSTALAAWTVASAAALTVPGVGSIAYFETWGPRGIADEAGHPYPAARALAWLHELAGRPALAADHVPAGVWLAAAEHADGAIALVANLTTQPIALTLATASAPGDSRSIVVAPLTAERVTLGR